MRARARPVEPRPGPPAGGVYFAMQINARLQEQAGATLHAPSAPVCRRPPPPLRPFLFSSVFIFIFIFFVFFCSPPPWPTRSSYVPCHVILIRDSVATRHGTVTSARERVPLQASRHGPHFLKALSYLSFFRIKKGEIKKCKKILGTFNRARNPPEPRARAPPI